MAGGMGVAMGGGVSGCMVVAHNKTYVANDNGEQE
jgi:hypothetical protein